MPLVILFSISFTVKCIYLLQNAFILFNLLVFLGGEVVFFQFESSLGEVAF